MLENVTRVKPHDTETNKQKVQNVILGKKSLVIPSANLLILEHWGHYLGTRMWFGTLDAGSYCIGIDQFIFQV